MKCPKCGYNSFEYHDTCTKCSHELTEYKQNHGFRAIVLPRAARAAMAESYLADNPVTEDIASESASDMFSFDLPTEEPAMVANAAPVERDPFSFIDEPAGEPLPSFGDFSSAKGLTDQAKAEEEAFASLLESSSYDSPDDFGDDFGATSGAPAPAGPAASSSGDFDLENFSWDDTPVASSDDSAKPVENDFDSLFGDADAAKK